MNNGHVLLIVFGAGLGGLALGHLASRPAPVSEPATVTAAAGSGDAPCPSGRCGEPAPTTAPARSGTDGSCGGGDPSCAGPTSTRSGGASPLAARGADTSKQERPAPTRERPSQPDPDERQSVPIHPDDPSIGPENAPVTIVEFSSFTCGYCGRVQPALKKILETYGDKVRLVWKHRPLRPEGERPVHEAAHEAYVQGRFWEYHDALFAHRGLKDRDALEKLAEEVGLDMHAFRRALDERTHQQVVARGPALARSLGSTGTPAFFVNGRFLKGAQPFERFQAVIEEELSGGR